MTMTPVPLRALLFVALVALTMTSGHAQPFWPDQVPVDAKEPICTTSADLKATPNVYSEAFFFDERVYGDWPLETKGKGDDQQTITVHPRCAFVVMPNDTTANEKLPILFDFHALGALQHWLGVNVTSKATRWRN